MAPRKEHEFEASPRMTEHEALMWNIEKDPWLNASGTSLTLLDQPLDMTHLRRTLRAAIVRMPRLIERVVPGLGRLSTPAWAPDAEFDLDFHVREIDLSGAGDERGLFDLAARLYGEPLDRTRPLWRFVAIKGLADGRGALYSMVHHVISDGIGQMRMAEMYQQLTRYEPAPAEVDLEGFIAKAVASSKVKESGGDTDSSIAKTAADTAMHLARRQLGIARRLAGEVVLWPADPNRMRDKLAKLGETTAATVTQLAPSDDDESHGSPLWTNRSRHRRLEHVSVPVATLKAIGEPSGASVNDVFLAGLAEGAHRYHADRDTPVQSFNSSFVLSTRTDAKAGGNAFTPVPVRLSGGPISLDQRLALVQQATAAARERSERTGGFSGLSGIANLLPTSVVTRAARSQGKRIDFATSNLRGAPIELYSAGAKVLRIVVMGPVAGTGANITAMSYNGNFEIGLFIDPEAITEPTAFRDYVAAAFADMAAAVGAEPAPLVEHPPVGRAAKPAGSKPVANKAAAKKAPASKATSTKAPATKAAAKKAPAKKAAATKAPATKAAAKKAAAVRAS